MSESDAYKTIPDDRLIWWVSFMDAVELDTILVRATIGSRVQRLFRSLRGSPPRRRLWSDNEIDCPDLEEFVDVEDPTKWGHLTKEFGGLVITKEEGLACYCVGGFLTLPNLQPVRACYHLGVSSINPRYHAGANDAGRKRFCPRTEVSDGAPRPLLVREQLEYIAGWRDHCPTADFWEGVWAGQMDEEIEG
jgi:hypothetical protein